MFEHIGVRVLEWIKDKGTTLLILICMACLSYVAVYFILLLDSLPGQPTLFSAATEKIQPFFTKKLVILFSAGGVSSLGAAAALNRQS